MSNEMPPAPTLSGKKFILGLLAAAIAMAILFSSIALRTGRLHAHVAREAPRISAELELLEAGPVDPAEVTRIRDETIELLKILPGDGSLWMLHARAAFLLDDTEGTVAACSFAMDLGAPSAQTLWLRARALARLGKKKEAINDIDFALLMGLAVKEEAQKLRGRLREE